MHYQCDLGWHTVDYRAIHGKPDLGIKRSAVRVETMTQGALPLQAILFFLSD